MKKKTNFIVLSGLLVLIGSFYFNDSFIRRNIVSNNDLLLANVEALTQEENPILLHCSRATHTENCYKTVKVIINNEEVTMEQWVALRISAVEEYTVSVGSPIICEHAQVTNCPPGCI